MWFKFSNKLMSLKIVFMGTPDFAVPALKTLKKNKFNILSVYTQSPKKSQRGQKINISPVQKFAEQNEINVKSPEKLNNEKEHKSFKELSADIAIVVAYGKLIPKNFLNLTKFGFINIHASLLPKWRGAAPIQRAILNGDKKIGVSLMKIKEKLDSGPVLSSKELILNPNSTYGEIEQELSIMGAELLIDNLKSIENGSANYIEQAHEHSSYAKKINKNEAKINWNMDADRVVSQIHGLNPRPGAWFEYEKKRFKVLRVRKKIVSGKPGLVLDDKLTIGCLKNSIEILEIQREGKNKQNINDFLLGNKISKDTILN